MTLTVAEWKKMIFFRVLLITMGLSLIGCASTNTKEDQYVESCEHFSKDSGPGINTHVDTNDIKIETDKKSEFYEPTPLKVFSGIEYANLSGSNLTLKLLENGLFEQYLVPIVDTIRETKYEAHHFTGTFTPVRLLVWLFNPTVMNNYTFGCTSRHLLRSDPDMTRKIKTGKSEWREIESSHKILISGFDKDYELTVGYKGSSNPTEIHLQSAIMNTDVTKSTAIKVTCLDCDLRELGSQNLYKNIKTSINITHDFSTEKALLLASERKPIQPTNQNIVLPSESNSAQQNNELKTSNKVALVIGNKDYEQSPLLNPLNDSRDIKMALEQLGFHVIYRENANFFNIESGVHEFTHKLNKNSVGVFYYSGHGSQIDGKNYLIPVHAKISSKAEMKDRAYNAGIILDEMTDIGNPINIVILDACRNNPYKGFKGLSNGLASMSGPKGSLIAYATAPDSVAADGDGGGKNSVYTTYLKQYLLIPGLKVEEMFKKVRAAVLEKTGSEQVPWENSSITGDFCFAGC